MRSRAAVLFESPGRYEVVDVEVDEPKAHEVLVRYVASGLCHSDVHVLDGSHGGHVPMCAGHEGAGVVEEVGPGVVGLAPGDHVVASFIPSCGRCRYCAQGRMNLCQLGAHLQTGPMPDGTYRMHHDGVDLHQFLLISTFSQYAVGPRALVGEGARRRAAARRSASSAAAWAPASARPPTPRTCAPATTSWCSAPAAWG